MNFYEQIFSRGRVTGEGMTHFERLFAAKFGGSPPPKVREYTGAVPVTITADGTPLLDYIISGNTTQNGTPTPDNPIMPQGTGERTAQLYFKKIVGGSIGTDGGIIGNASFDCYVAKVEANQQYIGTGYVYAFYTSEPALGSTSYNGQRTASPVVNGFTSPIDGYVAVRHNADVTDAMLNTGSTALPYEPYGYKIPISSNNTTTPVYLGEVETTRKIKKIKASDITWIDDSATGYNFYRGTLTIPKLAGGGVSTLLSNKYRSVDTRNNLLDGDIASYNLTTTEVIVIRDDRYSSAADWLSANGDTEIYYVLATEKTAVVNEPLMRIGDYADTLSYAQAGATIPTSNGSTTIDVDTTVKPSEVYIKYKG